MSREYSKKNNVRMRSFSTEGMSREEIRKRRQEQRMLILRRRKQMMIGGMVLVLFLIIFVISRLFVFFAPRADETTLTLKENGKIVFEEVVKQTDGEKPRDVKRFAKQEIRDFKKKNGHGKVKYVLFSSSKGKLYLRTKYKDAKSYEDFTGHTLFSGTLAEAKKAGFSLERSYAAVKKGAKDKSVSYDDFKNNKKWKVLIVSQPIRVIVPGEVGYVTDQDTQVKDGIVSIRSKTGQVSETIILYK